MMLRAVLAAAVLQGGFGCVAVSADPLVVEGGFVAHEVGGFVQMLSGLEDGDWHHRSGSGFHCFELGAPEAGAHPDSVYFMPRYPRWAALIQDGPPVSWATTDGLSWPVPTFRHWWEFPSGYVALAREAESKRYAVAFVYIDESGRWLGSWDWQIQQTGFDE